MKFLNLILISFLVVSCAATPHMPGAYVSTKGNVTTTLAKGSSSKTGKACTKNYLGFITLGDASISAARKQGRIKKIAFIDNSYTNILGLYQEYCTLVRGK